MSIRIKLFTAVFFMTAASVLAQFNEYEPEYDWYTIKGEHVYVHFHPEAERTARVVAKIADEVWDPITTLYRYEPEPVHYVIKDIDDYSNGATFFFDNKIEIWASALDFDLRGSHNWLRNVISHEFTHMVQIQAAMKVGRAVPALYLQYLNYEEKRRPDILYGFPNFIASYPVATVNVPAWYAEGTAQYMRKEFNYDNWDSHRDMILRSYVLDDNMLTWNQMGVFGKTSLGNESVYNAGFALTRYIAQKYGEEKLREINDKLAKKTNFTIDQAFRQVLGKSGDEIYNEWKTFLRKNYGERTAAIGENLVTGDTLANVGFGNFYPVFSEDGTKVLYISNKTADYFITNIMLYDRQTKTEKMIQPAIRSTVNFIPGTNKLIYAKLSEENPKWKNIHDLYVYDIDEEEETRITRGLRANNPSVSPDGKKIVFLYQKDGTTNVGMVDINGKNFKRLTLFESGEQVYNPKFTPDGKEVVFGYSYHNGRDIARVDTSGANFGFIIQTDKDERNPVYGINGELYYASDKTGIFNIYRYNEETGKSTRLTNVLGGAFMPAVDDSGNVVYSGYTSTGYKIFLVGEEEQGKVDSSKKYTQVDNPPLGTDKPDSTSSFDSEKYTDFDDYDVEDYTVSKYRGMFTDITFIPLIRVDNYSKDAPFLDKIKPGLYVSSTDYLNRYSLFAGGAINKRLERDLFMIFEYRDKLPILYGLGLKPEVALELYSVSREASDTEILFGKYYADEDTLFQNPLYADSTTTDVGYSLFEVDLAFRHKIFAEGNNLELRFIYSSYTATINSFILPDENRTLYPTNKDNYFIGRNLQLKYTNSSLLPHRDSDINPVGMEGEITYNYENNEYNPESEYEVEDGILKPLYQNFSFHRLEADWKFHMGIADDQTLNLRFRGATVFGPPVPDFFDYYLGGLVGMKSYPFYAISGNELGWVNLTYRFPLWRDIDKRLGHLYFDKLFFSVYGDFGNAWTGDFPAMSDFKKGAGFELRAKLNSFYLFPTSVFFSAAYSFDEIEREFRGEVVRYGKEWQFYGGILFDFSL